MIQPIIQFSKPQNIINKTQLTRRWWVFGGVAAAGLLIMVLVIGSWWYTGQVYAPTTASGSLVPIQIEPGTTVAQMANQLRRQGLIEHPLAFRIYIKLSGLAPKLQSGNFQLPEHISIHDLAVKLQSSHRDEAVLRFTEGWRREEMADYIDAKHQQGLVDMTGAQFSDLALQPTAAMRAKLGDVLAAADSLQGFLFPDTYVVNKDETAAGLIGRMLENYKKRVSVETVAGLKKQGLTEYQGLILASLVERESKQSAERPIIAGILLSRNKIGMPLGVDATVQYALGYSVTEKKWWRATLTTADLDLVSPYNTRINAGLPPHPIDNPGLASIKAVAEPSQTDYLYYIHDSSGVVHYARTLAEHNNNIAKYLR